MSTKETLARRLSTVRETLRVLGTNGGPLSDEELVDPELLPVDVDPAALESPADVVAETGLTVEAYVVRVVAANGGWLPQPAFANYVGWSRSRISIVLCELEADGVITRRRVGRQKVIELPDYGSGVVDSPTKIE